MHLPKLSKLYEGPYTIRCSTASLLPFEVHDLAFKLSYSIAWGLWSLYICFQVYIARSSQKSSTNFLWRTWIVVLGEFFLTFQDAVTALNIILGLFSSKEIKPRPSYQLIGDEAPTVDVLITCCGEPIGVIIDTVKASAAQDYPAPKLRIFVLDDSQDEELRHAVGRLNTRLVIHNGPSVIYLSREKVPGVRSYFKAGNLRFGIAESERLEGSEFLAGLDADMLPEPSWLSKMVPHLLLDDKMALACPPQRYYNIPHSDPLGQQAEFSMFFGFQEALNDRLGAAMCTGSGYVVRRSALKDIGGWPLAECGEDFMCSAVLGNAGWNIGFVREELQSGLAPDSLRAMVKQRMRWIDACMEVCQHFGYYLPGSAITSQMTALQRAVNMLYALRDYSPVTTSLALILLPVALYPNRPDNFGSPFPENKNYLFWLQILYSLTFLAHRSSNMGISMYVKFDFRSLQYFRHRDKDLDAKTLITLETDMAFRNLISFLPPSLRTSTFTVCGATTSPTNERSGTYRSPLSFRLLCLPIPLCILYAIYAIIALLLRLQTYTSFTQSDAMSSLPLTGAMVKLVGCVFKVLVPVRYMLWPPTVPERDELVEEDEWGVRRPRWGWEERKSGNGIWWWCCLGCEVGVIWTCWR
ncbi:MAG: hypothetical protein Q9224_000304 [Gallowayella concinna]